VLSNITHRIGRPSPALVLSALALFVALGGTSYAVVKNSVTSAAIKNNEVRSKDIRNGQIRSSDVRDRSLLAADFKAGQLPAGLKGEPGAPGRDGTNGTNGTNGATGPAGPSDAWRLTATGNANGITLPVGSYVQTGVVRFTTGGNPMQCVLYRQPEGSLRVGTSYTASGAGGGGTLAIGSAFTNTVPAKLWVGCSGGGSESILPQLTFIKVGTLH